MITNLLGGAVTIDLAVLIGVGVGAVLVIATLVILIFMLTKNGAKLKRADKVKVKDGVRYSVVDNIKDDKNNVHITYQEGDFNLVKGKTYTAVKNGSLMPGKYTILSSSQAQEKYNIRFGGLVREYSHGETIVIAEDDTICSVSHSLVLR